ncbi:DNA-binding response regulator, OmpR family, contains REC and winged-helix (wHTH) domain [Paenibacillus catalpae]|uniref:DNA-binding response regulator, OmpR family, contains REC and winged-helix (WHTH) domain n=1 Tax=Paenibacillus catalpae TaxID=1045775 RepID=A0A1I1UW47_9BACL|nr:response regulator transcription factor [Paenibacillus catalpae]SFD74889.1 DNA-binding response regulator, OmpR family, contains REC and winged-helix (wHTH) domain [Paenibacillus catalpae]
MEKIIIIEDDPAISDLIRLNLELAGYECQQAYSGQDAHSVLTDFTPDLVLLDISLPDVEGYELLERFKNIEIPVIFLTARNALVDKVKGLKMGADDYIVKPFEAMELLARIEAVLRRYGRKSERMDYGGLEIHLEERAVKRDGVIVELTMKEYELLLLLINNRNKALSREKILELVWSYEYSGETRTVDIHIQKLRKKLGWEDRIKTVYKFGYRLEVLL